MGSHLGRSRLAQDLRGTQVALMLTLVVLCSGCMAAGTAEDSGSRTDPSPSARIDPSPSPSAERHSPKEPASEPALIDEVDYDDLANATYHTELAGEISLDDGTYSDDETMIKIGLDPHHVIADLDLDGDPDAAVVLAENGGGTAVLMRLVVMTSEEGRLEQAMATDLGDRVIVESLRQDEGVVTVELVAHGPDDGLCCPTQRELRTYPVAELLQPSTG